MSLFDQIINKVDSSIEPSMESFVAPEIDEENDSTLYTACEALGVKTKTKKVDPKDPEYELSKEEIEALAKTGASEEDDDDDLADETVDELLEGLPEATYGDDPEEVESELDADDLAAIDDDFEDD